jgi:hypothetical protein
VASRLKRGSTILSPQGDCHVPRNIPNQESIMRITLKTMVTTVALAAGALTLSACAADPYYANQNYTYSSRSTAYAQPSYAPDYYYAQPRYGQPRYRRY